MLNISNLEEFEKVISENEKVVIDLWAEWCGPCRVLGPTFERAAIDDTSGTVYAKVDIDSAEDVANKLGIRSIPTVVFFKSGKESNRTVGVPKTLDAFKETVLSSLK